ncbi:MAG TPA: adenosylmethionine--8-amino-7-oxononanoate transaminase [Pseudolabrys sp.]|nr:adenosylmethionine--8-amino-7-oxononanoate transaminase [Pseudolabrys sp.]
MPTESSKNLVTAGWYASGLEHIWLPYAQMKTALPPLPVVQTHGTRILLADGRELVDGIASWWTACHGYNHPHIAQAVEAQLKSMPHVMFGGLVHEQALRLAQRLTGLLPGDLKRVFFSDSGSVAIEVAMKMAAQYWANTGAREKTRFVSFKGGYHGDTSGAMSLSDPDTDIHATLRGGSTDNYVVLLPRDDDGAAMAELEALLDKHSHMIAAIVVEPLVQGAGGMRFHGTRVLQRLRGLADKYQLLLIFDEIFTGFGRTGAMFACGHAKVAPDIVTLSKALTGGTLPLAATVATRKVFDAFWSDDPRKALAHGPTFMANALACAAANASLDLFEREPRLRQVANIAAALADGLAVCRDFRGVKDVRVMGAIGVVELDRIGDLNGLRARFIDEGVFIRPIENVVYLTPAFPISTDDLSMLIDAIVRVLRG